MELIAKWTIHLLSRQRQYNEATPIHIARALSATPDCMKINDISAINTRHTIEGEVGDPKTGLED